MASKRRTSRVSKSRAGSIARGSDGVPASDAPGGDPASHPGGLAGDGIACGLDLNVLVLNRGYSPVRVVSARRAFVMLFKRAAEVVHVSNGQYLSYDFESWAEIAQLQREFEEDEHDWIRTVSSSIAVPRVIRLFEYDRLPAQQVRLNRRNLFARDRNRCQYCGKFFPSSELSIDHVVPRTQGGGESWENLVCSCVACNSRKGGRTPDQARMKLIRSPGKPKRHPLIAMRLGNERYQTWKAFLDEAYWNVELR